MPRWRALLARWPHSVLQASEGAVGLPAGQMGNSEVGHLNLGAGRPVLQDLPRIDAAIADGSFERRPALLAACERARETGRLHTVGLVGPGGVHAHDRHLVALVRTGRATGRPVRPGARAARRPRHPAAVGDRLRARARGGARGGAPGRADRVRRWALLRDGPRPALGARSSAATTRSSTGWASTRRRRSAAIEAAYARGETDEFVVPTVIDGVDGRVRDGDAGRARQLPRRSGPPAHRTPSPIRTSGVFDRAGPAGEPPPRDLLVVTMTGVRGGSAGGGRVRARGRAMSLAGAVCRGRLDAVPRRRDREVRARHVLLQRRPRGGVAGRGADARPHRRRSRPTTCSPR